jgi:hypothetical protein
MFCEACGCSDIQHNTILPYCYAVINIIFIDSVFEANYTNYPCKYDYRYCKLPVDSAIAVG